MSRDDKRPAPEVNEAHLKNASNQLGQLVRQCEQRQSSGKVMVAIHFQQGRAQRVVKYEEIFTQV